MLQQLEEPLLCSSIRPLEAMSGALDDGAVLLDRYAPRGLDYVVDDGKRFGEGSSVVDMTVCTPTAQLPQHCALQVHSAVQVQRFPRSCSRSKTVQDCV